MQSKTHYTNGQKIYEQKGNILTYYFKTGIVKVRGKSVAGVMEGKWIFNRDGGQLWQVGNFKQGVKQGEWVRYNKVGKLEYRENFEGGKKVVGKKEFDLPSVGKPAERALAGLGITRLQQLTTYTENEIAGLHGVGPKALLILKKVLRERKLGFRK